MTAEAAPVKQMGAFAVLPTLEDRRGAILTNVCGERQSAAKARGTRALAPIDLVKKII